MVRRNGRPGENDGNGQKMRSFNSSPGPDSLELGAAGNGDAKTHMALACLNLARYS